MGAFKSIFRRKPPETPIRGFAPKIENILVQHGRGVLGVLVPILLLSWQLNLRNRDHTALHIYIWMACFFFFQPVSIQVTGTIPIFAFPMLNIITTDQTVKCFFNEGIALFLIGGMLHLLLNNSGFDRRLAITMLCKGDDKSFSPQALLIKCSLAAFLLSIFCHRLIVASTLTQYMTPLLLDMQTATARYRASEPNFDEVRYVICNAIQTSCSIGGIVLMHSSYCTLAFRAIFMSSATYPDFLNYAQYTGFAFPVAIVLFGANLAYHVILLKVKGGKDISVGRMATVKTNILKFKSKIPANITNHEKLTIIFEILALAMFFARYIHSMNAGWVTMNDRFGGVADATVASIFVVFLHVIPRSCNFVQIFRVAKKSKLPPTKPESAILFWRFVDKNTNYGYFFVIGTGIALWTSLHGGEESPAIKFNDQLQFIKDQSFCVAVMIICIITVALTNIISGVAAVALWLPVVLCLSDGRLDSPWFTKMYQPALAVGVGSSFGYISPFLYTPAYFCHHTGKVPKGIMCKYSLIPCLISAVLLCPAVCMFAPKIFGEEIIGRSPVLDLLTPPTIPPDSGDGGGGGGDDAGL